MEFLDGEIKVKIKIPSMLWIHILRHILFFNPTSEYFASILRNEIPRYKLNRNPIEVPEG
jgi:hypothetical protein